MLTDGQWITFNHGYKDFGVGLVLRVNGGVAQVRVLAGGKVYSGDVQVVSVGRCLKHVDLESARATYRKFGNEVCA